MARVRGTSRKDVLHGTQNADTIFGLGAGDHVSGGGGGDRIRGGAGADFILGGAGHDRAYGDAGNDKVFGGAGNDALWGGAGRDRILGQGGNDKLYGGAGADSLFGGAGSDLLFGQNGADSLMGGAGNDTISGGADTDVVIYTGSYADYDISVVAGGLRVAHARGTLVDGTDLVLADTESLRFTDQTISSSVFLLPASPTANDDAQAVAEDLVLNGTSLLANDSDPQAAVGIETLVISEVNGSAAAVGAQITLASGALLTVSASGEFVYDPNGQFESLGSGQTAADSFQYTVSDGAGGTDTATVNLTIQGANDAPTVAADAAISLNVLSLLQIVVDPSITISDVDDTSLVGAEVQISSGLQSGDTLEFTDQNGITGSYDGLTGTLTLTGTASVAAYEAALESIVFHVDGILGLPIGLGQRTITFTVDDGEATSAVTATSTALLDVIFV